MRRRNIIPIADRLNKAKVIRLVLPIGRAQIEIVCSFVERIIQAGRIVVRVDRLDLNKHQSIDLVLRQTKTRLSIYFADFAVLLFVPRPDRTDREDVQRHGEERREKKRDFSVHFEFHGGFYQEIID